MIGSAAAGRFQSLERPCRILCWLLGLTLLGDSARAELPPTPSPAAYRKFDGAEVSLYAWRGSNVAFLTASTNLEAATMGRLLAIFDRVRGFYRDATGRDPATAKSFEGRATMAEVSKTCGAACGYLGATGIELTPGVFRDLYDGFVARGEIDQALPYEFGRNFWFYSPQLAPKGSSHSHAFVTGYAVFMRFPALDAAGVSVGEFRERSGAEFRKCVEDLVDLYVADRGLSFTNTLATGAGPKNPMGLNATDLFAGFCMRLARDHGGSDFVKRLWQEVGRRPVAKSPQDGIDNFVIAASSAAGSDLGPLFVDMWRWPVSEEARKLCREVVATR